MRSKIEHVLAIMKLKLRFFYWRRVEDDLGKMPRVSSPPSLLTNLFPGSGKRLMCRTAEHHSLYGF